MKEMKSQTQKHKTQLDSVFETARKEVIAHHKQQLDCASSNKKQQPGVSNDADAPGLVQLVLEPAVPLCAIAYMLWIIRN